MQKAIGLLLLLGLVMPLGACDLGGGENSEETEETEGVQNNNESEDDEDNEEDE